MKRFKQTCLILVVIVTFFTTPIFGQQKIDAYLGTWRWVSGNKDTFLLSLKPAIQNPRGNAITAEAFGFHAVIEKGRLIESSLSKMTDTLSESASVIANMDTGGQGLRLALHDLTREAYFYCTLLIVKDMPDKAILVTRFEDRKHLVSSPIPGRTVPDNIVLEKIK